MSYHTAESCGVWRLGDSGFIYNCWPGSGEACFQPTNGGQTCNSVIVQRSIHAWMLFAEGLCPGGRGRVSVVSSAGLSLGGDGRLVASGGKNVVSEKLVLNIEFRR